MNISDNIACILTDTGWKLYTNRSYTAKIQKADPAQIYNVPDQPGIVYNWLEDAYERVAAGGYVITGAAGEMWPVGAGALAKYDIAPEKISHAPQAVRTIENDTVLAGIQIPAETVFTLETDYGEKALLTGNRSGIPHGSGDFILVAAKKTPNGYVPDFEDCGRIVNGSLMDQLYQPFEEKGGRTS